MRRALWCPDDGEEPITCDWCLDDSLDDDPTPLPRRRVWLAIVAGAALPLALTVLVAGVGILVAGTLFLAQAPHLVGFAGSGLP
ncbi:MAG TPA: hypothetical protein ENK18_05940 [Deltaproteobacteria bacterium]|nr:hypothetical protein [Deltaproteobacteria bacterium]